MGMVKVMDLLPEVLQICRECPSKTAIAAYVRATRQFCKDSRWLTRNIDVTTEAGKATYDLSQDSLEILGIKAMSLTDASGKVTQLTEGNSGSFDPNKAIGSGDLPEQYAFIPASSFALYKTPAIAVTVRATAVVQPTADASEVDDKLLPSWRYALEAGALAYLLGLPRTPWTDKAEARVKLAEFTSACFSASHSAARGYNAGAETTTRNGNPSGAIQTRILPI